ncbi:MAG: hypothetical protein ACXVJ7_17820 [Acidimicrobiia bacterium]
MTPRVASTVPPWLRIAIALLMVAPAVVAIVVIVGRPWHPVDDLAIIDLHVRDVWSVHFPLTGLFSRPGWNHPGPAMFWLIGLLSGVTGGAAWATRVGGPVLAAIAFVWLAVTTARAGRGPLLAAAAVSGFTFLAFEPWVVTDPWNLHIPLPYFVVFLFLTVLAAAGSSRHLIGMSVAASLILQTHVAYGLLLALGFAYVLGWILADARRSGHLPPAWKSTLAWCAGIWLVSWIPPLVDVVIHWPGNLGKVASYFAHGAYTHVGLTEATRIFADDFRPIPPWLGATERTQPITGLAIPASLVWLAVPAALLVIGLLAARRAHNRLTTRAVAFAAVLAVGAIIAISRADGPHAYTFQWRSIVAAFLVVVCVWAAADWLRSQVHVLETLGVVGACAVLVWGVVDLGSAVRPDTPGPLEIRERDMAAMLPAMRAAHVRGRNIYVSAVGGTLPTLFGGVIDELDRLGAHVFVKDQLGRIYGDQRRVDHHPIQQTWYVTEQGSVVPSLLTEPGARLLSSTSPLTPARNRELDRLQAELTEQLLAVGQGRVRANLDQSWIGLLLRNVAGIDHDVARRIGELDRQVSRDDGCRCAIVVVPGAPSTRN